MDGMEDGIRNYGRSGRGIEQFARRASVLIHGFDAHRAQIGHEQKIGAAARCDGTAITQAVVLGRVVACHRHGLDRVKPKFDRHTYVLHDVAFTADIIQVLVVGAEQEAARRQLLPEEPRTGWL